jgi:type I protein arginine methyltransferase
MYSLDAYLEMIADRPRIEAYEEAIRRSVFPGATVVDIGAGPGIMAMLACRHGAARVWAIEPADVAEIAKEIVRANGFADRITVIAKKSTEVELPDKADVVVSDLRGILPFLENHIPSIVDARARLLKPGGVLVPRRDRLFAALASAEELHPSHVVRRANDVSGFDFSRAGAILASNWTKAKRSSIRAASEPALLGEIDYHTVTSPHFAAAADLVAAGSEAVHGLVVWFDTDLVDGVGFSNEPGDGPDLVYARAFFPWPAPRELRAGDTVRLTIDAKLVKGSYLWRWRTELPGETFDQSTLAGALVLGDTLKRHRDDHVPEPSPTHELDLAILGLIDGKRTNKEIAAEVRRMGGSYEAALDRVAELALRILEPPE